MMFDIEFFIPLWAIVLLALVLLPWHVFCLWRDTWTSYLAIFHLDAVKTMRGLPPMSNWWGHKVLLPRGLRQDWQLNLWLTLVFLDLPHHPAELVTGRLQRYINPKTPALAATAPRWLRLLWPARMAWWRAHRWWWQLLPYRRRVADRLAADLLDPYDPPSHIDRSDRRPIA
ncbi:hypothetical protein P3G55_23175 [Leptospira sp. 96542]|nr:hypothetical protein [Leptospira sp. 96542]